MTDQKFVLERELQLIECGLYCKLLKDAGYADEVMNLLLLIVIFFFLIFVFVFAIEKGSFSQLREEDLKWLQGVDVGSGRPVAGCIPRQSRLRILALAETVKRRLQREDKESALTEKMKIEAQLLQDGKILGLVLGSDGDGEADDDNEAGSRTRLLSSSNGNDLSVFCCSMVAGVAVTKKADLQKQWERREKARQQREREKQQREREQDLLRERQLRDLAAQSTKERRKKEKLLALQLEADESRRLRRPLSLSVQRKIQRLCR